MAADPRDDVIRDLTDWSARLDEALDQLRPAIARIPALLARRDERDDRPAGP